MHPFEKNAAATSTGNANRWNAGRAAGTECPAGIVFGPSSDRMGRVVIKRNQAQDIDVPRLPA